MTGMEQFLAEQTSTSEDAEKVAQAELFLKLASKNGINLDSLTNDQINELWSATFSKTAEEEEEKEDDKEKIQKAKEEHEKAKESAAKVAEAEMMGRVMAESYVNHLQKIASKGGLDFSNKAKEEEKTSSGSYLDELACQVALQKVAQAGLDVDEAAQRLGAVLTLGAAESEKIAHVHQFGDAVDVRSSELLEMAGYPIDWSGTPFHKESAMKAFPAHGTKRFADKAWDAAKKVPGVKDMAEGRWAKGVAKTTGAAAVGGGVTYGATKGIKALGKKKKDEGGEKNVEGGEKKSSVSFDIAAAQTAVEKAASVGWNADEAVERLNAVLTLGPGDPATSEKVAAAQTEEQALEMRACELLELAGYPITWN